MGCMAHTLRARHGKEEEQHNTHRDRDRETDRQRGGERDGMAVSMSGLEAGKAALEKGTTIIIITMIIVTIYTSW